MIQEWASINDIETALRSLEVQESWSVDTMETQARDHDRR